jgi:nitrogen-specific signal transduction histidine kinase
MKFEAHPDPLPPPPYEALREGVQRFAETLRGAGDEEGARTLESMIDRWSNAQAEWNEVFANRLRLYHEINNALVGVRGNAQLLLLGPHGEEPDVRQRLEVVIRESTRIKEAASVLRQIREDYPGQGVRSRAA